MGKLVERFISKEDQQLFKESLLGLHSATRDLGIELDLSSLKHISARKWCCLMRAIATQLINTEELDKFAPDEKLMCTLRNALAMFLWFDVPTENIHHPMRGVHTTSFQFQRYVGSLPASHTSFSSADMLNTAC